MISIFSVYAAPFQNWGPWVIDPQAYSVPANIKISAQCVTQAPSTFDGMVEYFTQNSKEKTVKTWLCPGSTNIKLDSSLQQIRFRFRAPLNGFQVRVTVNDHFVMIRPQDDTTISTKKYPINAVVM